MIDPANDDERRRAPAPPDEPAAPAPPPLPGEPAPDAGGADGEPPELPRTWTELFPPRPKPPGVDYGFMNARGEVFASARDHLLRMARTRSLPPLVWAPETAGMVPPWEAPFLLQAIRDDVAGAARRELRISVGGGVLLTLLFWVFAEPSLAMLVTVGTGALLVLLAGSIVHRMRQAARMTPAEMRAAFDRMAAQQAESVQPAPATRALAMALLATGLSQLFMSDASIQAGGLRLDAVRAGEVWRLFTAPMLHGNVLHFWLNYMALESLGRTIETRGPGPWVPLVFLVSALAGGVASLALPPDGLSVGASGGLMGMFGFLAVMAYRRKRHLPPGFLRLLLVNIAIIAGLGLLAYRFVDNAAHAGGLLAGVGMGLAAVPEGDRVPRWTAGPRLERAGRVATWIVRLSAVAAIGVSLWWTFGG